MTRYTHLLVGLLVGLTGCSEKTSGDKEQPAETSLADQTSLLDEQQSASLTILIDGKVVKSIQASEFTTPRTLVSLLPSERQDTARWHSIEAKGDARTLQDCEVFVPGCLDLARCGQRRIQHWSFSANSC
jgi:hypothetical protein